MRLRLPLSRLRLCAAVMGGDRVGPGRKDRLPDLSKYLRCLQKSDPIDESFETRMIPEHTWTAERTRCFWTRASISRRQSVKRRRSCATN